MPPLSGDCTRGPTAVTQTLTCSENQGDTAVSCTWTPNCPVATIPTVPVDATSIWSLIALQAGAVRLPRDHGSPPGLPYDPGPAVGPGLHR